MNATVSGTESNKPVRPVRLWGVVLTAVVVVWLGGCGADTYERRLSETCKYFEYLDTLNKLLTPSPWTKMGVSIRVPKQFELLPEPDSKDSSSKAGAGRDPRQPNFWKITLPGLLGAWKATVPVDTDQGSRQANAYLYICSNHDLWIQHVHGSSVDPMSFDTEFASRLAPVVHAPKPETIDDWPWTHKQIPPPGSFAVSKWFDTLNYAVRIKGLPYELQLFRHVNGNIHVMILYIIPEDVPLKVGLKKAVTLSLHTLEVSKDLPTESKTPSDRKRLAPNF